MAEVIKTSIIGFGLMGGSIAKALRNNKKYRVLAYNRSGQVLEKAKKENAADEYTADEFKAVKDADLVIVCLYPALAAGFILRNMDNFKSGAVITDICGVKRYISNKINKNLRKDLFFIPAHPMAGKEKKGFEMSDKDLFKNCNYIIAAKNSGLNAVSLVASLARDLGASNIVFTDETTHDAYIAYTSQLPHAISCAYVKCLKDRNLIDYAAGSLKDVSRVADINAVMWAELFIKNSDNLSLECENMAGELLRISEFIKYSREEELKAYMQECADTMERFNG